MVGGSRSLASSTVSPRRSSAASAPQVVSAPALMEDLKPTENLKPTEADAGPRADVDPNGVEDTRTQEQAAAPAPARRVVATPDPASQPEFRWPPLPPGIATSALVSSPVFGVAGVAGPAHGGPAGREFPESRINLRVEEMEPGPVEVAVGAGDSNLPWRRRKEELLVARREGYHRNDLARALLPTQDIRVNITGSPTRGQHLIQYQSESADLPYHPSTLHVSTRPVPHHPAPNHPSPRPVTT
eukprot:Hpha_TRINITY_DN410_c0_g1::TRINITY_DN410_c0_g1_i1::g.27665::m.27665